jgi:hypothetical protein
VLGDDDDDSLLCARDEISHIEQKQHLANVTEYFRAIWSYHRPDRRLRNLTKTYGLAAAALIWHRAAQELEDIRENEAWDDARIDARFNSRGAFANSTVSEVERDHLAQIDEDALERRKRFRVVGDEQHG